MRNSCFRNVFGPLSACALVAGCATPQQTASLECGAGAAGVSYLACKLLGNSDRQCAGFAVVGAGIGAAACYSYASRLEKRRQELAGRENNLSARLNYVRGLNADAEQLNTSLRSRVDKVSKDTATLEEKIARNQITAAQLNKEHERLDREVKTATEMVALQEEALNEIKTYRAGRTSRSADLDAEIAKQERLLSEAKQQVVAMTSLRERV